MRRQRIWMMQTAAGSKVNVTSGAARCRSVLSVRALVRLYGSYGMSGYKGQRSQSPRSEALSISGVTMHKPTTAD